MHSIRINFGNERVFTLVHILAPNRHAELLRHDCNKGGSRIEERRNFAELVPASLCEAARRPYGDGYRGSAQLVRGKRIIVLSAMQSEKNPTIPEDDANAQQ